LYSELIKALIDVGAIEPGFRDIEHTLILSITDVNEQSYNRLDRY